MPSNCPKAPDSGPAPAIQTHKLSSGAILTRFHSDAFPANSFNPNIGKDWTIPDHGARFSPFPDDHGKNVPSLYAADDFSAAALESVFHAVEHVPSPRYPASQLESWFYSEMELKKDVLLFELTNPNLRQLSIPGRSTSLEEGEVVHAQADQYPNTRTWARYLHAQIPTLQGLAWRPRLGGQGTAFIFFGDRCNSTDFEIRVGPLSAAKGPGLAKIKEVATAASIRIIASRVS